MLKLKASVVHEYLMMGAHDEGWVYDTYLDNLDTPHDDVNPDLTEEQYNQLRELGITVVVADFGMSENHIGGDVVISCVDQVLNLVKQGREVLTWYGPKTQALVIGVMPGTLELIQE